MQPETTSLVAVPGPNLTLAYTVKVSIRCFRMPKLCTAGEIRDSGLKISKSYR